MNNTEAPGITTRQPSSLSARSLRVLTLTPFYPSAADASQGCFVSEPLTATAALGISNEVIAVQPFYRPQSRALDSNIASRWRKYFSLPGNAGLASGGKFLAAAIRKAVHSSHAYQPFDLIHAHAALPCGHAAAILSSQLKIPFCVSVHGLDAFSTHQAGPFLARSCQKKSAEVYRHAQAVICVSEKVRQQVAGSVDARTAVIYNGVDPSQFSPVPVPDTGFTILSVGNLTPTKGHALLLRAFADISAAFPASRLEIVGTGSEGERLKKSAADLGIASRVRFLDRQSREAVAQAMRRCAVFALPSSYEGLGCVYLEAMASGKPSIGCHRQGIDEVIEHGKNGFLIQPGNQAELAETLRFLLVNEGFRLRIGAAARSTILQRHTLEHQARQFVELYQECA